MNEINLSKAFKLSKLKAAGPFTGGKTVAGWAYIEGIKAQVVVHVTKDEFDWLDEGAAGIGSELLPSRLTQGGGA